jgi:hypothetical protein
MGRAGTNRTGEPEMPSTKENVIEFAKVLNPWTAPATFARRWREAGKDPHYAETVEMTGR